MNTYSIDCVRVSKPEENNFVYAIHGGPLGKSPNAHLFVVRRAQIEMSKRKKNQQANIHKKTKMDSSLFGAFFSSSYCCCCFSHSVLLLWAVDCALHIARMFFDLSVCVSCLFVGCVRREYPERYHTSVVLIFNRHIDAGAALCVDLVPLAVHYCRPVYDTEKHDGALIENHSAAL